jgi:7,8-dihydropterin-6-yl-methyl-4-(beta-D-ribofuranosyl)aminobenzene 5'-phosphate synthase
MIKQVRLTALAENTVWGGDLLAEHGLSLLIEADGHEVLFDTGQGKVLLGNARQLGVKLVQVEAVVLSHGHYDHTGGLARILTLAARPAIYLHPAALEKKYARLDTPPHRSIGIPAPGAQRIRMHAGRVVWTRQPAEVCPGIYVTGEVPRNTDFEDTGGPFFLDESCSRPDPLIDDQALYIESVEGLILVLGCAHAGVVNTLEYVSRLTGRSRIHAVLGGMHLWRASKERVEKTVRALERFQVRVIGSGHCTGPAAVARLQSRFGSRVVECITGSRLRFGGADRR